MSRVIQTSIIFDGWWTTRRRTRVTKRISVLLLGFLGFVVHEISEFNVVLLGTRDSGAAHAEDPINQIHLPHLITIILQLRCTLLSVLSNASVSLINDMI